MYSTRFVRGTATSLQALRIFINCVGSSQSLFDSQTDFCAGGLLEPGAHFYRAAGCIHQLGLIPGAEFIRAILQVHGR